VLVFAASFGCSDDVGLPVVTRGRFVEIATDRSEAICGGTVAFMDRYVAAGFELIGETPPDGVFVRYEWLPAPDVPYSAVGEGRASIDSDGGIVIRADRLINEHELVHAVHLTAWPASARFLHEGLAVLLDSKRSAFDQAQAPSPEALDDVLDPPGDLNYSSAYFLVSQIILDHGMDGLRDLWRAVPAGATAPEVRAAYEEVFDEPIDVLLEPWIYVGQDPTSGLAVEIEIDRAACDFTLCTEDPTPWIDDVWSASGPSGCEDDPDAIGPASDLVSIDFRPVWTEHVMDAGPEAFEFSPFGQWGWIEGQITPDALTGNVRACWAQCGPPGSSGTPRYPDGAEEVEPLGKPGLYRVELGRRLDELPTDDPGELVYQRSE
jgi:hypothetical protein